MADSVALALKLVGYSSRFEIERLRKMWRSNFLSCGRDQVDDSILAVIAVLSGADCRKLVRSPLFARSRGVEIFLDTAAYSPEVVRCHGKTKSDNADARSVVSILICHI